MSLCYLDRRYYEVVLRKHGCTTVLPNAVYFDLNSGDFSWKPSKINTEFISYGCLVVHRGNEYRHSTFFCLDPKTGIAWWWDPFLSVKRTKEISKFFASLGFYNFHHLLDEVVDVKPSCSREGGRRNLSRGMRHLDIQQEEGRETISSGDYGGYCNAYVLKFALSVFEGAPFDGRNIERFAADTVRDYERYLPDGEPEIEYGDGALVGGLGGALIGGAIAGPGGLLLGGATGATLGALSDRSRVRNFSRHDSMCLS